MFRFAIDRINADMNILAKSKLIAQVEKTEKKDSFHADKKGICCFLLFFHIKVKSIKFNC